MTFSILLSWHVSSTIFAWYSKYLCHQYDKCYLHQSIYCHIPSSNKFRAMHTALL